MNKISQKITGINLICLILFILDRLSKNFFINNPAKNIFGLTRLQTNSGFILGWLPPKGIETMLFLLITIILIVLCYLLVRAYHKQQILEVFAFTLIITGALGNLLDRALYRHIVDFLDIGVGNVFNLSDIYITGGVIFLLYFFFTNKTDITKMSLRLV